MVWECCLNSQLWPACHIYDFPTRFRSIFPWENLRKFFYWLKSSAVKFQSWGHSYIWHNFLLGKPKKKNTFAFSKTKKDATVKLGFAFALFGVQALFDTTVGKWDHWIENGKYLISYDDSELTCGVEKKTIAKALEVLESVTSLKFVKYNSDSCTNSHPCSWYMKFRPSERTLKHLN